ncbi:MAG: diaminopimelate epimerase [Parvibaculales bacterium]
MRVVEPDAAPPASLAFSKMNGLGNDFVILDARPNDLSLSPDTVRQLAARDNRITQGCDQLLIIQPPRKAGDIFMQIFNADGSEAQACGNGTRAVAAWLAARDGMARSAIDTLGGLLACVVDADGTVEVTMGQPRFDWQQIPLARAVDDTARAMLHPALPPAFLVNIGNPHAVFLLDANSDLESLARQYGAALECHELFPEKANIGFACPGHNDHGDNGDNHALHLRVWERGAGLTRACGSGACAAAIAAIAIGGFDAARVDVHQPMGVVQISRSDNGRGDVRMRGPATFEFDGEVSL